MKKFLLIVAAIISVLLGWQYGVPADKKELIKEKNRGFWKKAGGFLKKYAPKAAELIKEAVL